jgi:hypothetical protein
VRGCCGSTMTQPPANRTRRHGRTTRYIAIVRTSWVKRCWGVKTDWLRCVAVFVSMRGGSARRGAVQASLPQPAPGIMTIWIRLAATPQEC